MSANLTQLAAGGCRLDPMFALLDRLPAGVRVDMLAMYRDALVEQVALMCEAIATGDLAGWQSIAHKVAGSSAMMQDSELSQTARRMEAALREGRVAAAREAWPVMQECAQYTLEALDAAI